LERAKIAPTPDWSEDQVQVQQKLCDSRVIITNAGQQYHPPNCTAISVHLTARESAQYISAPDVMWTCAWCLVSKNITQK